MGRHERRMGATTAGRGSDLAGIVGRRGCDLFADALHAPTTRERAAMVTPHAERAEALLRTEARDEARGAAFVAAVAAIRMAVTPVGSAADHAFKARFLRRFSERVDPSRRDRFDLLVEVALEAEADGRRLGGLGVEGDDRPATGARPDDRPSGSRRRRT